jgi:hypothetical protein
MSEITPAQKTALLKLEGFKEIQKQYAKEQKMAGSGKRRMKGKGFWDDVWGWFKSAGQSVNDFLKRTKLISNVAGAVLPLIAPIGAALLTANPIAAAGAVGAAKATAEGIKSLGYGSKSMHRMPDGSMMKGKMHGGMMMKGRGNDGLAINLPNQRMKGVNPKSKMRGAGLLENVFSTVAPLAASTISNVQNRASYIKKMTGKGYGTINNTVGVNGVPQRVSAPAHSGMMHNIGGKGMKAKPAVMKGMGGTEYGVVTSEFGNVQF